MRPTNTPARLKAVEREAEKKAIETARYVIPIGAFTSMVHTVSGLVLHRLHRMMNAGDTPYEAQMVIGAMVDLVNEVDPMFFDKVGLETLGAEALPEAALPRPLASGDAFARDFDQRLGGRVRGCGTGPPAPRAWWPKPCAPPSGSPPRRWMMRRRSIG